MRRLISTVVVTILFLFASTPEVAMAESTTPSTVPFVEKGHRASRATAPDNDAPALTLPKRYPTALSSLDPEVPEPPTRERCLAEPGAEVSPGHLDGWYINRYGWCAYGEFSAPGIDTRTGQVVANFSADFIILGYGNNGARQFDYLVYLEDIRTTGTGINWDVATMEVSFAGCTVDMQCPEPSRVSTIPGWRLSNTFATTFTSPDVQGGGDQIVRSTIALRLHFSTPTQPEWVWGAGVTVGQSPIRYDSATYVGRARGAVFPNYRLVFTVDTRLSNQDESALHILHAIERPELTFPSWLGKSVPGKTTPLTRMYNPAERDANREKSVNTCLDVFGSWDGSLLNCDEYPFASTYEGAKTGYERNGGLDRYSVRLIDVDDNQYVGAELLEVQFYRALRVLDGDQFYVNVLQ